MIVITLVMVAILAPVVAITAFFAAEVMAGLRPLKSATPHARDARGVILIPAHNEEGVIGPTVAAMKAEGGDQFELVVVADNCTDRTADIARAAGAAVIVRDEPERRGKGFALAFARELLRSEPPDVVIVVDADCRLDRNSLRALAFAGFLRPCQAVNLLASDLRAPALVQISTFAFMIKNLVRQRGLQRIAGRVHLTGTGMAFPWTVFAGADLGGSNIVEDLALGLELSRGTARPTLIEAATVWSPAASADGTLVQRRRWEGGYLATALKTAPPALMRSLAQADVLGLCGALDLCVPPLALLFVLNAIALLLTLVGIALGGALWPVLAQIATGTLAIVALALAWSREGRRFASGASLLRLPLYVLWKLPLYAGLARRGAPKEWLRTGR